MGSITDSLLKNHPELLEKEDAEDYSRSIAADLINKSKDMNGLECGMARAIARVVQTADSPTDLLSACYCGVRILKWALWILSQKGVDIFEKEKKKDNERR